MKPSLPCLLLVLSAAPVGCANPSPRDAVPTLRYVGSSTIAHFIRDAEPAYGRARFLLDTEPESAGGELAILEGRADLGGVAGRTGADTLKQGVTATLIGHDAIAVVVNRKNPLKVLTRAQLKDIFTGKVKSWKALGGPDLPIRPYIVSPASATRNVFRSVVLGEADYKGCEDVRPDGDIPAKVEADPGGIGTISFSFLGSCGHSKPLAVDGEEPLPTNPRYPIVRPLYLLFWPGRERVKEFIAWTGTPEARAILLKRFSLPSAVALRDEASEQR